MRKGLLIPLVACLTVLAAALAQYELSAQSQPAASSSSPKLTLGEFLIDPPTLINLGFEWFVDGDDNRNGAVAVSYRKHGATAWRDGLSLLRVQHERITNGKQLDVIAPNMFAGSVLDLEPDTAYDVRFVASIPTASSGRRRRWCRSGRGKSHSRRQAGACSTFTRQDSRGRRASRHSKA